MEPDQYRRKKRGPLRPREGRPGKLVRQPTETLGMQSRRRERQMRKRRQEGSRLRASDVESGMGGYMTGGQAKIAAKAPPRNKIDGKDFAVLRAEKAKGRGQGLQDEKLKPGKVTKAALGVLAAGLGARKRMKDKKMAPMAMGAVGAGSMKMDLIKKILGKKDGGMGEATKYKKYLKGLKNIKEKAENKKFEARRMRLAGGKAAMNAIKASRVGKIAAGVAGAALLAKAGLEKMYEKRTGKKPFTKRPAKKMGGGMMQRPVMGYKSGKMIKAKCKLGRNKPTKLY